MANRFVPVCVSVGLWNGAVGVVCWLEEEIPIRNQMPLKTPPRPLRGTVVSLPMELYFQKPIKPAG